MSVETSLRQIAKKLLSDKQVDIIIGYEKGSLPLRTTPCFINNIDDVKRLVWNGSCENNLAKYVVDRKEKVGVITKGCDARSIVTCIIEKQIERDNVVMIGVPCSGVIDRKKVEDKLEGMEILHSTIDEEQIVISGDNLKLVLVKEEYLHDSCKSCRHNIPPMYDIFVGEKVRKVTRKVEEDASRLENMTASERWEYFEKELGKCIRCYACRNACPLCYCNECFVDQSMPSWLDKTDNVSDLLFFHVARVFHVAGRCVDCGACSRACPMGINLRSLNKKVEALVNKLYNYEAGLSLKDVPPLATFKLEDPQDFIK